MNAPSQTRHRHPARTLLCYSLWVQVSPEPGQVLDMEVPRLTVDLCPPGSGTHRRASRRQAVQEPEGRHLLYVLGILN